MTVTDAKTFARHASLTVIGLLLVGYVLGNKGFAHLGWPPVYVGEIALAVSFLFFLFGLDLRRLRLSWPLTVLGGFVGWCFLQTLPYIDEFGFDALRDSAIYGYSIFAMMICLSMRRSETIERFLEVFSVASRICVILLPLMIVLSNREIRLEADADPIITLKAGDAAVHLMVVLAFRILGLDRPPERRGSALPWQMIDWLFWACWGAAALWTMINRGGILSLLVGLMLLVVFSPMRRRLLQYLGAGMVLILALWIIDFRVELPRRAISVTNLVASIASIVGSEYAAESVDADTYLDYEGTKEWRLEWWEDIVADTVFGPYFWSGRGFGENLAEIQGIYIDEDEAPLRSPHNGHLTILARAGVPGLALWIALQAGFGFCLLDRALRMKRRGEMFWYSLNVWTLICWTASLTVATFDVYLEGPQGGIWFWSIMGFGFALIGIQSRLADRVRPKTGIATPETLPFRVG